MRERAQAPLNRGPLLIAKGLRRPFQRRIGMQLERKPTRLYAKFQRRLLDPDRAEIAKRSNDVGPDQESPRIAHEISSP
jgi:hypothetical protein